MSFETLGVIQLFFGFLGLALRTWILAAAIKLSVNILHFDFKVLFFFVLLLTGGLAAAVAAAFLTNTTERSPSQCNALQWGAS